MLKPLSERLVAALGIKYDKLRSSSAFNFNLRYYALDVYYGDKISGQGCIRGLSVVYQGSIGGVSGVY